MGYISGTSNNPGMYAMDLALMEREEGKEGYMLVYGFWFRLVGYVKIGGYRSPHAETSWRGTRV